MRGALAEKGEAGTGPGTAAHDPKKWLSLFNLSGHFDRCGKAADRSPEFLEDLFLNYVFKFFSSGRDGSVFAAWLGPKARWPVYLASAASVSRGPGSPAVRLQRTGIEARR